ncbi:RtcB family protein [Pelagibius marinus]|uniref:RtcB family protein n=1 Tax=Pelagibius marinus TaxID=2762760 RepID=UPI001872FB10|nr:RtcB family protein [Pelagibius marinus]
MAEYETFETGRAPVKAWVKGVPVEEAARRQLENIARLPFIHSHVAAMPDVHLGKGATVGSVIATKGAIVPAAVGVDIGCGMMAMRTSLSAAQLPDSLAALRSDIERAVPHGGIGVKGGWKEGIPDSVGRRFIASGLADRLAVIEGKHEKITGANHVVHLGTLGTGNHFIEVCLDEEQRVWVMLHSGSRGIGNRIGSYFITQAREALLRRDGAASVPDRDLAWFEEGEALFDDYVEAVHWAQDFARANREVMMERILRVLRDHFPAFRVEKEAVNCHHNYVARERHFDADVWVTRKGAVRAGDGELGIIPGSMGARSYIVRGLGKAESFCSCSHGAGRTMSRSEAKRRFTLADHAAATEGVECRKDQGVIDETPQAYKDIDAVMAAQRDLVAVEHTLKQVLCVKG